MAKEPAKQEAKKTENKRPAFKPRSSSYRGSSGGSSSNRGSSGGSSSNRGSSGGRYQQQRRPGQFQRRGRFHRRKVCLFCADKTKEISWKKLDDLRRFVSDSGSIYPRRKSGTCARHQRRIAIAIKRARHLALMPYTTEHIRVMSKR